MKRRSKRSAAVEFLESRKLFAYSITPNPASVNENAGPVTFTVTRSGSFPAETIWASTTTTEGFANSSDYTGLLNQAVTFTSGQTSKTVSVSITNDSLLEPDETFGFIVQRNQSDPVTTYLAKSTFRILNDDVPTAYSITPNPASVNENAGSLTFTVTRSGSFPAETIWASTTQTEGFTNNSDYTGFSNQGVTFTSGQTSKTVSVTISDDTTQENSETFGFIVQRNTSDPVSTFLAKSTFTIINDDVPPPTYSITPNPANVNENAGPVTFTITRSGSFPAETIWASTTQTEGFTNNSDYTGFSNQGLTFTSGQTSRTVSVSITDDSVQEPNETFGFIVQRNTSDPVTTFLARSTFTIVNNDVPPTYALTPNPANVNESEGSLTFTVTRSGSFPAETIFASTVQGSVNGYSTNNNDYTGLVNQQVTFGSGEASKTVSVSISDDTTQENSETFGFIVQRNSTDPVSTFLAKREFTIIDDDLTTYSITPNPANVNENAGPVTFTVTRSGSFPAETIWASTTTTEGFANSSDYTGLLNQAVTFTSGQTSKTVSVTITNDSVQEPNETFGFIVQRNQSDPVTTYLAKSTFMIVNDDGNGPTEPPVTWLPSPNFAARPPGTTADSVVIHTTEATYQSTINTFQNPATERSAHYVIRPTGEITQMVNLSDAAWHATYYNSRSIGIEMVGFADDPATWTPQNLASLEALSAWLAYNYSVPVIHPGGNAYDYPGDEFDAVGFVGHSQIQPWNRTDPGPHFPWSTFVANVTTLTQGSDFASIDANGKLNVFGTANGDAFWLDVSGSDIVVSRGSQTRSFASAAVQRIIVSGGSGDDTLELRATTNRPIEFSGGTGLNSVDVPAGSHTIAADLGTGASAALVSVGALASLTFLTGQHLHALAVSGSTLLGGNGFLVTKSLTIAGGSKLDLNDNDLVLDYTGPSQFSAVQTLINSARNGGDWLGSSGITSTPAKNNPQANTTLGAIEASDYIALTGTNTFSGQPIDSTAVLVKYTYYGDANFSGNVDFDDYVQIDLGHNFGRTGWINGDFDGSGLIDFDDYVLIDIAFNTQGPVL